MAENPTTKSIQRGPETTAHDNARMEALFASIG
jgi:hypothetical protein